MGTGGRACDYETLMETALERRGKILQGEEGTDAFRVIDGADDGFDDGTVIDQFAGRWLVQTLGGSLPPRDLISVLERMGRSVWWKRLDKVERTPPRLLLGAAEDGPFVIRERGVCFEVDFAAGYSQGIFLDQRLNRKEVARRAPNTGTVLNLFAYTGAFSIVAALGGSLATTLDLSSNYLNWARRNFELNGMDPSGHYFCRGDALDWLDRWAKSGRTFDGVIADPPTFSRNESGRVWQVKKDCAVLVERVARVLAPGGWALFCTNYRGMGEFAFETEVRRGLAAAGMDSPAIAPNPMPAEYSGERYLKSIWVG